MVLQQSGDHQTVLTPPSVPRAREACLTDLGEYDDLWRRFSSRVEEHPSWRVLTTFQPNRQLPVHGWFYCPQSFSAPLVDHLFELLGLERGAVVLDPFSGVGTTAVEARLHGLRAVAGDVFPLFCFITEVKAQLAYPDRVIGQEKERLFDGLDGAPQHPKPAHPLFDRAFPSEVLDDLLRLKHRILGIRNRPVRDLFLLGLLSIVNEVGFTRRAGAHYRFVDVDNPGVRHQFRRAPTNDRPVADVLRTHLDRMQRDVATIRSTAKLSNDPRTLLPLTVRQGDARNLSYLEDDSVNGIITSPPYLNRDSYVAQYKLELFLAEPPFGVSTFEEYRELTKNSLASHVEALTRFDDSDTPPIAHAIAEELAGRQLNNPGIPGMVAGYFRDMTKTSRAISRVLSPRGKGALVVGNVRFAGLHIPVDLIVASLLESEDLDVERIVVTRYKGNSPQQMRRFGAYPVRESTIIFRKRRSVG